MSVVCLIYNSKHNVKAQCFDHWHYTRNKVSFARTGGRSLDGSWTPEAVCVAMHLYEPSKEVKCQSNLELARFLSKLF